MTVITAKFPGDLPHREGDRATLDAVLTNGGLIITRMVRRDLTSDRQQAVAHFLERWPGAGQPITDHDIRSTRTAPRSHHVK
jgi:hypothetical protein